MGNAVDRPGGVTYLIAVVIVFGKGFARQSWQILASDEFLASLEKTLGQPFYPLGDIY